MPKTFNCRELPLDTIKNLLFLAFHRDVNKSDYSDDILNKLASCIHLLSKGEKLFLTLPDESKAWVLPSPTGYISSEAIEAILITIKFKGDVKITSLKIEKLFNHIEEFHGSEVI
jgi:hypothetical protein